MKSKKNKLTVVKNQIVNSYMKNGKKHTGEKILLKLSKSFQKLTQKNFQSALQLAIIHLTPAFKLNEQVMKKGKKKSKKMILAFITKDSLRIMTALKFIKIVSQKNRSGNDFSRSLCREVLGSSLFKSLSVEQKTKLQNQILLNKRYLNNFKW